MLDQTKLSGFDIFLLWTNNAADVSIMLMSKPELKILWNVFFPELLNDIQEPDLNMPPHFNRPV